MNRVRQKNRENINIIRLYILIFYNGNLKVTLSVRSFHVSQPHLKSKEFIKKIHFQGGGRLDFFSKLYGLPSSCFTKCVKSQKGNGR